MAEPTTAPDEASQEAGGEREQPHGTSDAKDRSWFKTEEQKRNMPASFDDAEKSKD